MDMQLQAVNPRPIVADELLALRAIDAANAELRARNEARLIEAKIALGEKYVLHPCHSPLKMAHRNVLDKREIVNE